MISVFLFSFLLGCAVILCLCKNKNNDIRFIKTTDSTELFQKIGKLKNLKKEEELTNEEETYNNELLISNLNFMLEKGVLSDVDIQCGKETFKAHKCVLSARSPVFETMFKCPMKENNQNVVVVKDIDPEAVRAMLEHLYTGKVTSLLATPTACELLALSDMYELKGLKKSCVAILLTHLSHGNAVRLLVNGDLYNEQLKLHAAQYICAKFDLFENMSDWVTLQKENPSLAMEILTAKITYMKLNI